MDKLNKDTSMFMSSSIIYSNNLDSYSTFIKKHLMNDLFFSIFTSYYPDQIVTKERISTVIKKYVFGLDDHIEIPLSATTVHKTINQLTTKISKVYITDFITDTSKVDITRDWLDLLQLQLYSPIIGSVLNVVNIVIDNVKFYLTMRMKGYICKYVSQDIRMWISDDVLFDDKSNIQIVVLDTIVSTSTNTSINEMKKPSVFVEMRGLTNYAEIFDLITLDRFNNYPSLEDLTSQFGRIIDSLPKRQLVINLYNSATILGPYISSRYWELYTDLILVNPICYPYAYHTFFTNIPNIHGNQKYLNNNFIRMFNRLTLPNLYLGSDKQNRMYDDKVHVVFSDDHSMYTNKELLILMLPMYSRINVHETMDDIGYS